MYLSRLHIRQVRVFDDITLYFKNEIKILIGENNSGNTAIIDALRICIPLKRIYALIPISR
ncbi:AAA family ATPase [uncultured Duncaniella sp.]|jgi:putative ATP-dependent endonuclease of OLD family|uniref:AAA family ATPase n=1 Tax=uncultured Duncaniella sp. TaxID=2768039 RepID=UPI0025B076CF|nr:AAA family ATPase [uncultured Duncaniella sp.]